MGTHEVRLSNIQSMPLTSSHSKLLSPNSFGYDLAANVLWARCMLEQSLLGYISLRMKSLRMKFLREEIAGGLLDQTI